MISDLYGAIVLLVLFTIVIALVEYFTRKFNLDAETARKSIHLGGGLGCLLFPFLVSSPATVLLLAVMFGMFFWYCEKTQKLKALSGVERKSSGSVYYPFAVALLFWMAAGRYWLYLAGILILALSDSAAALVGSKYGRFHYRVGGVKEHKSLEGSLLFWLVSFLAVYIPLRTGGQLSPLHAGTSAFLAASLLAGVEAVSTGGRDNLYVPLLTAFILLKVITKPEMEMVVQVFSMTLLLMLLLATNRIGQMMRTKELLELSLIVFGAWSLGSPDWAIPLLAAILLFTLLFSFSGMRQRQTRAYRRIVFLAIPAAALVLIANISGAFAFWFGPYVSTLLLPSVWGAVIQTESQTGDRHIMRWNIRQVASALSMLMVILGAAAFTGSTPAAGSVMLIALAGLLLVWCGIKTAAKFPYIKGEYFVVFFTILLGALTALGQTAGMLDLWQPYLWADVFNRDLDLFLKGF